MIEEGNISAAVADRIGTITFSHPKGNSLPGHILKGLAKQVDTFGSDPKVHVVILRSEGDSAFCGGASFDELLKVKDLDAGREFFSGFANLILSMKRCPKFIISRVHAKVVGGGVGVVAASDYALAVDSASVRLSELAIGIGPFTIGPAVQRKIGLSAFNEAAISAEWRDAKWAKSNGLYVDIFGSISDLDAAIQKIASKLAGYSTEASRRLKAVLWEGTEQWEKILADRVQITSELVITDFAQRAIDAAKNPSKK